MHNVTSFPQHVHMDVQAYLPWYVTDQLEPGDRARIEAHLEGCAICRADVAAERALAAGVADLPAPPGRAVDQGWTSIQHRLDQAPRRRRLSAAPWLSRTVSRLAGARDPVRWSPRLGMALAAQACVFMVVGAALSHRPSATSALYRGLSSAATTRAANIVVLFRPETPESRLHALLDANHARFVDGPTVSGAYLLEVPAGARDASGNRLQQNADVLLAQPIGEGGK